MVLLHFITTERCSPDLPPAAQWPSRSLRSHRPKSLRESRSSLPRHRTSAAAGPLESGFAALKHQSDYSKQLKNLKPLIKKTQKNTSNKTLANRFGSSASVCSWLRTALSNSLVWLHMYESMLLKQEIDRKALCEVLVKRVQRRLTVQMTNKMTNIWQINVLSTLQCMAESIF